MRCGVKCILVTSILVAAFAYHLYVPLPPEFTKPWPTTFYLTFLHLLEDISGIASLVMNVESLAVKDAFFEFSAAQLSSIQDRESPIKIEDKIVEDVPVRIYTPNTAFKHGPAVIYYHGGGWRYGSVDLYDDLVYKMAKETNYKFISVDYRRSVTDIYPAAHEDCLKVTKYILKNSKEFSIDKNRIAVMGDSAGGSLAATVSLELRKSSLKPKLQVLIYPITQAIDYQTPSYQMNGNRGLILSTLDMLKFFQYYATGETKFTNSLKENKHITPSVRKQLHEKYMPLDDLPAGFFPEHYKPPVDQTETDPCAVKAMTPLLRDTCSPLFAEDLEGLPDAYVYTAFYDVLRDEGVWYANRLKKAGISVEHFDHRAAFHAMINFYNFLPEAEEALDNIISFVLRKL